MSEDRNTSAAKRTRVDDETHEDSMYSDSDSDSSSSVESEIFDEHGVHIILPDPQSLQNRVVSFPAVDEHVVYADRVLRNYPTVIGVPTSIEFARQLTPASQWFGPSDCLDLIGEYGEQNVERNRAIAQAIAFGTRGGVKALLDEYTAEDADWVSTGLWWQVHALSVAFGRVEDFDVLQSVGAPVDAQYATLFAARYNSWTYFLDKLQAAGTIYLDDDVYAASVLNAFPEPRKWLLDNGCPVSSKACLVAVLVDRMDVFLEHHDLADAACDRECYALAAALGRVQVVIFYHDAYPDGTQRHTGALHANFVQASFLAGWAGQVEVLAALIRVNKLDADEAIRGAEKCDNAIVREHVIALCDPYRK